MGVQFHFAFRDITCRAEAYFSFECEPCYLFILLKDEVLISEFGEDITIKTDCERVLPKKDDYPALTTLRKALFDAVKVTDEFLLTKASYQQARGLL